MNFLRGKNPLSCHAYPGEKRNLFLWRGGKSFSLLTRRGSMCCQPTGEPGPRGSSGGCETINDETQTWQSCTCAGTHLAGPCRAGGTQGELNPPQTTAGHGNASSLPGGKNSEEMFWKPTPLLLVVLHILPSAVKISYFIFARPRPQEFHERGDNGFCLFSHNKEPVSLWTASG